MRIVITGSTGFVGDALQNILDEFYYIDRISLRGEKPVQYAFQEETALIHAAWDFTNSGANLNNDKLCGKVIDMIPKCSIFVFISTIQSLSERNKYAAQKIKWEQAYNEVCQRNNVPFINVYLPHLISLKNNHENKHSVFYKFRSLINASAELCLEDDKDLFYTTDIHLVSSLKQQLDSTEGCIIVPPMRSIKVSQLITSLEKGNLSCDWLRQFYGF